MKENKGFSLIELVVVIAIMSIVTVGVTMSASVVSNRNVNKSADLLVSGIKKASLLAMTKADIDGFIIKNEEGTYFLQVGAQEKIQLGKMPIKISYTFDDEQPENSTAVYHDIDEGEEIEIKVSRSSGAFQSITVDDEQEYYYGLKVSNGRRYVNLKLIPVTGKIMIVK